MKNIRKFLQVNYSDEKLAALLAHAQDGRLSFSSCCCLIGVATADHALRGHWHQQQGMQACDQPHYKKAINLDFAFLAESEFKHMTDGDIYDPASDEQRRQRIIPIILEEMKRREDLKAANWKSQPDGDYQGDLGDESDHEEKQPEYVEEE